jgi:hypothetical protein
MHQSLSRFKLKQNRLGTTLPASPLKKKGTSKPLESFGASFLPNTVVDRYKTSFQTLARSHRTFLHKSEKIEKAKNGNEIAISL